MSRSRWLIALPCVRDRARLVETGIAVSDNEPFDGHDRFYIGDPLGNRVECLQRIGEGQVGMT